MERDDVLDRVDARRAALGDVVDDVDHPPGALPGHRHLGRGRQVGLHHRLGKEQVQAVQRELLPEPGSAPLVHAKDRVGQVDDVPIAGYRGPVGLPLERRVLV